MTNSQPVLRSSGDSDDSDDDNCAAWFSAFQRELGFEEVLLGLETGEADVHADELHDEFKLCARFDGERHLCPCWTCDLPIVVRRAEEHWGGDIMEETTPH